jgi:hypothetical protein
LLLCCLILLLLSCSKTNNNPQTKNYSNAKGTYINITNTQWYTTTDGNFVTLKLKLSGNANGDRITILTVGDGLDTDNDVPLKANKTFNYDTGIAFFYNNGPRHGTYSSASTWVTIYRCNDTLKVNLNGGNVNY